MRCFTFFVHDKKIVTKAAQNKAPIVKQYERGSQSVSLHIEEHYDKIYRYCYFRVYDASLAEDLTQEAFLRYFEHYGQGSETTALKVLYTIARNLCIDDSRRKRVDDVCALQESENPEERLVTKMCVDMALAQLSDEEQELLLLRYVNEVPVVVMAEMFGISRFAVYRKVATAAKKFKGALRKEEDHEKVER